MIDPTVKQLKYAIETREGVYFMDNCPAITLNHNDYSLQLENCILTCDLNKHFSTESEARLYIAPVLRAWEIYSGLQQGREEFQFRFLSSEIIDRNPPPPPPPGSVQVIAGSAHVTASCSVSVKASVGRSNYPNPPTDFTINEDIEMLWDRYNLYQNGEYRDMHLLSTAYFFATYLEYQAVKKNPISSKKLVCTEAYYNIDISILRKINEITSIRGSLRQARKISSNHILTPISNSEAIWINACIIMIIKRLGEKIRHQGCTLSKITMSDLPPLSN